MGRRRSSRGHKTISTLTMKFFSFALLASALANAIELPRAEAEGFTLEQYESGFVHETLMGAKMSSFARHRAAGEYASEQYPALAAPAKCENGLAIVEHGN